MPAQTSPRVTWGILTGVKKKKKKKKSRLPFFFIFFDMHEDISAHLWGLGFFRRRSEDTQPGGRKGDAGYCQGWELPGGWRVMERYERQTKEPWQAENYSWMDRGCRSTHSCVTSYFRARQLNTSVQQVVRPVMNCVSGSPGFAEPKWWIKLIFN